jgi:choline-glycine betaine transporter
MYRIGELVYKKTERGSIMEKSEDNNIAKVLTIIAWITYVGGFIAGLVFGSQEVIHPGIYTSYTTEEFLIEVAIIYWASAFVSGSLILGFAEVIKLLQKIEDKMGVNEMFLDNKGQEINYDDLPPL